MRPVKLSAVTAAIFATAVNALVLPLPAVSQTVAGKGPVLRLNAAGKEICGNFDSSGAAHWVGKVRGKFLDGYAPPNDNFVVRTCFKTEKECINFVNRIENRIYPIDFITFVSCKPR